MFEMKISSMVSRMVDGLRPTFNKMPANYDNGITSKFGIGFKFDLRLYYYYPEDEQVDVTDEGSYAEVMFLLCGNTNVFMAVNPTNSKGDRVSRFEDVDKDQWVNTSNHDSCWRSDGLDSPLSKLYFEMADDINKQIEKNTGHTVAPKNMDQFCNFGGFGSPFEYVLIEHRSKDPMDSYRQEIVKVLPVD